MLESYFKQEAERQAQGIPPLPLNPEGTEELCRLLENPPKDKEDLLMKLLKERVAPGVDPAAEGGGHAGRAPDDGFPFHRHARRVRFGNSARGVPVPSKAPARC